MQYIPGHVKRGECEDCQLQGPDFDFPRFSEITDRYTVKSTMADSVSVDARFFHQLWLCDAHPIVVGRRSDKAQLVAGSLRLIHDVFSSQWVVDVSKTDLRRVDAPHLPVSEAQEASANQYILQLVIPKLPPLGRDLATALIARQAGIEASLLAKQHASRLALLDAARDEAMDGVLGGELRTRTPNDVRQEGANALLEYFHELLGLSDPISEAAPEDVGARFLAVMAETGLPIGAPKCIEGLAMFGGLEI